MSRRRPISRSSKRRVKRVVWLIVEGETELYYFTGFRNDPKRSKPNPPFAINIKNAGGRNPQNVVDTAEKYRQQQMGQIEEQRFFCVFDAEDSTPRKREALDAALRDAAKKGFQVVLSNPCFEVWLHCHLNGFKPRQFISCKVCVDALSKAWMIQRISQSPYIKGDTRIYETLSSRLPIAIKTARSLREVHHQKIECTADANASTDVYRLMEFLQGLTPNY